MNSGPPVEVKTDTARSDRFHRWRARKDRFIRRFIGFGGISVILAVGLIFFYLLWVVFPLLLPAHAKLAQVSDRAAWQRDDVLYLSLEEQLTVGLRVSSHGHAEFFNVVDDSLLSELPLVEGEAVELVRAAESIEHKGLVAIADREGGIRIFRHFYETRFEGGVESKKIVPSIEFPYQQQPVLQMPGSVSALAFSDTDNRLLLVASTAEGLVRVVRGTKTENFMTGELNLDLEQSEFQAEYPVTDLTVSGNHRWLYVADDQGSIHRYQIPELEPDQVVRVSQFPITRMTMLLGGTSILAGDSQGVVHQLFPVREESNRFSLVNIRQFERLGSPIEDILPEQRRRGFVVLTESDEMVIFHSTSGQTILREPLGDLHPRALALAPRANGLMIEGEKGQLALLEIENEHPETSFSSLWRKVWYENYDEPQYVWQSSSASNDFEPKFSLTPLVFGTIKAAFYAMLFAIPLALMGAAYTAYFMSPALRQWVKPTIEIMAALPTVILGFVAGLWFAPFLEENLAGVFMVLLVLPVGLLLTARLWHYCEFRAGMRIFEGREVVVQIPVIVILVILALWLAQPVQNLFFAGDLRDWLSQEAGISYDQRNAMVVGCAMGFAVIPTIFSIAEDAVFGVPRSLSDGSLALGATPWQSLVRVVLPTASPGIFSALMIGLGRAVGETMIVLMATGNTPIMDWNLFEGMRTLAANIAVEMPESEVASSHYRILFLAALVLFLFTFVVNTGAEVVRQRLRVKYSSL
jgi:phosphate transport system permease protein